MDALVPMASQPTEMSGRNWMMRRMLIDSIRKDPDWNGGNYTTQPRALRVANVYFGIATNGGIAGVPQGGADAREGRQAARRAPGRTVHAPMPTTSCTSGKRRGDYNPSPGLDRIQAPLLAINSADDERNPPELKIMERELKRVKDGRLFLIPASEETRGHGTTASRSSGSSSCTTCSRARRGGAADGAARDRWPVTADVASATTDAGVACDTDAGSATIRRWQGLRSGSAALRRRRDHRFSAGAARRAVLDPDPGSGAAEQRKAGAQQHDPAEAGHECAAGSGHHDAEQRDREQRRGARDRVVDAGGDAGQSAATAFITVVVSGATVIVMPRPSTTTAGKNVVQ